MMKGVMKIGGGILKDKKSFGRVVDIIKNKKDDDVVVVLSALYGVTDYLIESVYKVTKDDSEILSRIKELRLKHTKYLDNLKKSVSEKTTKELDENLKKLERYFYGVNYLGYVDEKSYDMITSFGERLSPLVLSAFLNDAGINNEVFDSEKAGIVSDGVYANASVVYKETISNIRKNVKPVLSSKVVLVTGFYGVDEKGNINTFGRGGTDYTAGVVANALDADYVEIWKDTNGFMTADPKVVENAKKIESMSYDEAEELGYLGAKILFPKTIAPIRMKKIPAEIKSIFEPEAKGTVIESDGRKTSQVVKSVASNSKIAVIHIDDPNMATSSGYVAIVFSAMADACVEINLIATAQTSLSFTIHKQCLEKALGTLRKIKDIEEKISHYDDVAIIGVIGHGMKGEIGMAGKIFSCLAENAINIEMISQAANEINISFVVNAKDEKKAVKAIHKEFIG